MNRSGTWKRISRNWGLYLLLLPSLVLLILFAYKPMYGVVIAFKNYKNSLGILGSPWAEPLFKNFQRFFNSYQCEATIRNTLRLSLYSLAVGFPIPIILALMINQITAMRFRRTFQTILYLPHFISTVVMVGLLLIWLSPSSGLVGAFYRLLGKDAPNVMTSASGFPSIYVSIRDGIPSCFWPRFPPLIPPFTRRLRWTARPAGRKCATSICRC